MELSKKPGLSRRLISFLLYFFVSVNILLAVMYYAILRFVSLKPAGYNILVLSGILVLAGFSINGIYLVLQWCINKIAEGKQHIQFVIQPESQEKMIINFVSCIVLAVLCVSLSDKSELFREFILALGVYFLGAVAWLSKGLFAFLQMLRKVFIQWFTLLLFPLAAGEILLIYSTTAVRVISANALAGAVILFVTGVCAVISGQRKGRDGIKEQTPEADFVSKKVGRTDTDAGQTRIMPAVVTEVSMHSTSMLPPENTRNERLILLIQVGIAGAAIILQVRKSIKKQHKDFQRIWKRNRVHN